MSSGSKIYPRLVGSVEALSEALGLRDSYTRGHCDRVVRLATELGNACDVLDAELDQLRVCARFHDVGKVGIPDAVLLKPGRLSEEEWVVMRRHSEFGEQIFAATSIPDAEAIGIAIRHHHEAYDGSGYPDKLAGERIPIVSRILLIVDAYDAMSTGRSYHRARAHKDVMSILESEAGKKLDPAIYAKFARLIEHSPARAN